MDTSTYGPLKLSPRLDAKPWGGRRLERFGFNLPAGETIGEALITASESVVTTGPAMGRTLGDIVAENPLKSIGQRGLAVTHGFPLFPILIKLIDASQHLSIQVHPTDETAPTGSLGKTEAWHILDADDGVLLFLGLKDGIDAGEIERVARSGSSTAHLMRSIPAVPGTTVFLPAGTVHALGAGVLIFEIQQPSGITYRLDDWGRVDASGNGRELHIEQGIAVIDPDSRPVAIPPRALPTAVGTRTELVRCTLFTAERLTLPAGGHAVFEGEGAPQIFTVTAGTLTIRAGAEDVSLAAGESVALLANAGAATLISITDSVILRGWLDPTA